MKRLWPCLRNPRRQWFLAYETAPSEGSYNKGYRIFTARGPADALAEAWIAKLEAEFGRTVILTGMNRL